MAIDGQNRHYKLVEIKRRHWLTLATRLGLEADAVALLDNLIEQTPLVLGRLQARLPSGFPSRLFDRVANGTERAAQRLAEAVS